MRQTNHANDFVNAKSHEKRDWTSAFLWLTSTKFRLLRSKMKWRSHKIDNRYKLSLRQSVMMHPFRPSSIPALFFSRRKFKYLHLLPSLATFTSSINSSFYFDRCVVKFFDIPACFLILAAWLLPWFTVQSMHQSAHLSARKSKKKMNKYLSIHFIFLSLSLMILFTTVQKYTLTNNNNHHHKKNYMEKYSR